MDSLSHKFVVEANELLEKLENALFALEENAGDTEKINEIFRVMHTLKGSGTMFGFSKLSAFTHELESIYDRVRNDKLPVDKKLLDHTFRSIDLIRNLLNLEVDEQVSQKAESFTKNLKQTFLAGGEEDTEEISPPPADAVEDIKNSTLTSTAAATWYIHFEPNRQILKQGSRPLFLLDELFEEGKGKAFLHTDHLPALDKMEPESAYFYWDILLSTTLDENHLRDIFVFVEDDSNLIIKKLDDRDWFEHPQFEEQVVRLGLNTFIDDGQLDKMKTALFADAVDTVTGPGQKETEKKQSAEQAVREIDSEPDTSTISPKSISPSQKHKNLSTLRIDAEKLDTLLNLISEMVTIQARLEHFQSELKNPELEAITESYQKLSYQLRENALDMRLIPFYTILTRFKRLVRDLSEELHKEVQFVTRGTETELDKSMIEKLYDPIMHVLRNSLDHGIESPHERKKAGKPEKGLLQINTFNAGSSVVIEISDDGRGIDVNEIREKAIQKGWLQPTTSLSEKELLNFIFRPGLSTSEKVTDVSGRGVGMDVVKKNIADLRGEIELNSVVGKGTTVKIILPLTLSIIDGLLVYVGSARYIIPLDNIKHIYEVSDDEIETGFKPVLVKDGRQIPYVHLIEEFQANSGVHQHLHMVVVYYNEKEMGMIINDVVGNYQAVIKPIGKMIQQKEFFSGASILGDGDVALVLDTNRIINQFINEQNG